MLKLSFCYSWLRGYVVVCLTGSAG